MLEVKLEIASNGVIKTVSESNFNGAGVGKTVRCVYETENDKKNSYVNTMKLFYDISDDLGVDFGNKFDSSVLSFKTGWGTHYEPTLKDIQRIKKELSEELKYVRSLEKEMEASKKLDDINQKINL